MRIFFVVPATGEKCHEISIYYYMKYDRDLTLSSDNCVDIEKQNKFKAQWIDFRNFDKTKMYPEFLKKELFKQSKEIKHIVTFQK